MPSETPPFGVLLINLGTPDEPTPRAIRRYLKQFLWDPRVIDTPRVLWWLILHLIILPIRPKVIAKNYQSIWTDKGSPLLVYSNKQKEALRTLLTSQRNQAIPVEIAMTYGSPSIKHATDKLLSSGISHLVVLPLYPQFSATTTGAALDALSEALRTTTNIPEISFIRHYYKEDDYIKALANSIRTYWEKHGKPDKLLFSFHGIPEHYETNGDPYPNECRDTAHLTAEALGLEESEWMLSFQSRVGRAEWVKPYTDKTLESLGEQATGRVDVICPAFSVDCLETLEEIDQENRHIYMGAGGQEYHYIPCLNANQEHIEFFSKIIQKRV